MTITRMVMAVCLFTAASLCFAVTKNQFLGKHFCSDDKVICVKGSMDFNYSKGRLEFHGRVKRTTKPGRLKIHMEGLSKKNEHYSAVVAVRVEGRYSEIIKGQSGTRKTFKNRRDISWRISRVDYK